MSYRTAMNHDAGMIFASDSDNNAGGHNLAPFAEMRLDLRWQPAAMGRA